MDKNILNHDNDEEEHNHHEYMIEDFKKTFLYFLSGYSSNSYFISYDPRVFEC